MYHIINLTSECVQYVYQRPVSDDKRIGVMVGFRGIIRCFTLGTYSPS